LVQNFQSFKDKKEKRIGSPQKPTTPKNRHNNGKMTTRECIFCEETEKTLSMVTYHYKDTKTTLYYRFTICYTCFNNNDTADICAMGKIFGRLIKTETR